MHRLTLHMLWIDLSKSFMIISRAVGQLLQASRGVRAQVRKAVGCGEPLGRHTAGPTPTAGPLTEEGEPQWSAFFWKRPALLCTESDSISPRANRIICACNTIAGVAYNDDARGGPLLAAIGTQHQGTFTAIHYRGSFPIAHTSTGHQPGPTH